ncbi:MAG: pyruvate kinase [bacterium]
MQNKRTKIMTTIGPSSNTPEMIEKLVIAGTNLFRVNSSHSDLSQMRKLTASIRRVEKKLGVFVGVLLDLQGPKIRTGKFKKGFIEIRRGDKLVFTTEEVMGDKRTVPIQYKRFHHDVKPGHHILLDDGNLSVLVKEVEGKKVTVEVTSGGTLSNYKGLNLPEGSISGSPFTQKDKQDLLSGLACGIDFVALSFVKTAKEIRSLRKMITAEGYSAEIIAKIERHEAIKNLDSIIKEADGIMVARGDMGVEIPFERVPLVQNEIVKKTNQAGKPVIVATQMLESMINSHRATRAEISDIANAVSYYADALMLSAETAVGAYPVKAVEAMTRTALAVENYQFQNHKILSWIHEADKTSDMTNGVTYAANRLAESLKARAMITFTISGMTAKEMSKPRPNIPIFAFTPDLNVARRMSIIRGVVPFWMKRASDIKKPLKFIFDILGNKGLIKKGDHVVLTSGVPMGVSGATNMIRVETVR